MPSLLVTCMVAFLIVLCATPSCATDTTAPPPPSPSIRASSEDQLAKARALLDSWTGQRKELDLALERLTAIQRSDPDYAPLYKELARFSIMSGNLGPDRYAAHSLTIAESQLNRAISLDPDFADAYVLFGHLYQIMGRREEAKAALKKAKELGAEDDPWFDLNWAAILQEEDKNEEAIRHCRKVVNSNPPRKKTMHAAYDCLVNNYTALEQYDKVEEAYKEEIAYDPSNAWAAGNYAWFLMCNRGNFDAALLQAYEALKIMEYGAARFTVAMAYYGKWAQAQKNGNEKDAQLYWNYAHETVSDLDAIRAGAETCSQTQTLYTALSEMKKKDKQP